MKNNNKKFWDRNAKWYDKMQRGSDSSKKFFEKLEEKTISYLDKDMNVLELAMGPAMLTGAIAGACKKLTATDYSEDMVEAAGKKMLPNNVMLEVADATDLKYNDNTFDAVIIANALHIMPNPIKVLSEINRVLKKDGILIAPTYTRGKEKISLKIILMVIAGFKTYSSWNDKAYIDFLLSQGWKIVHRDIIYGNDFPESFVVCIFK